MLKIKSNTAPYLHAGAGEESVVGVAEDLTYGFVSCGGALKKKKSFFSSRIDCCTYGPLGPAAEYFPAWVSITETKVVSIGAKLLKSISLAFALTTL